MIISINNTHIWSCLFDMYAILDTNNELEVSFSPEAGEWDPQ